uniref:Pectate lyase n=1 Tax=Schlesneria paludicola TaxID=360056 RepID=A0A7C2JZV6_9PLAN
MNPNLPVFGCMVSLLAGLCHGPAQAAETIGAEIRAFPDAEGWGAATVGGRGGRVIKVTNLNSSGPGSLAEACAAQGPRIVIFEVSGVIRGSILITQPHLTIAGQTAPGAGITIEGMLSSYDYGVHDVIVRHLRVRRNRDSGSGGDCLQFGGLGPRKTGTYNIILDHLSLSWGNDEMIDLYHAHHVTVQWCTVEESDDQGHSKGAHNFGVISAAEDSGAVSLHHNLWAHHGRRVPCLAPYREHAAGDFCNNVVYNCRGGYTEDGHGERARSPVNLHKNYYRRGPQTLDRLYPYALSPHMDYYVRDNYFEDWGYQDHPRHWTYGNRPKGVPRWIQFNNNGRELDEPALVPVVQALDPRDVYHVVLATAGCWPRDRVTLRTIEEVKTKSGAWGRNAPLKPADEWFLQGLARGEAPLDTDGDGMPDAWEQPHHLNPLDADDATQRVPAGSSQRDRHQGYTYLEFYLNELADNLVPQSSSSITGSRR